MKISVMICTRNRAAALRTTLKAVFELTPTTKYEYEVVVVDNASTDATRLVVAEFIAALPSRHYGRLRYCHEPRAGLSHARNTALRTAQGDVLVFIDDDVLPAANWLDEICKEFTADQNLSLLGGQVLLAQAQLQPVAIVIGEQRQTFTTPDRAAMVMGANLAFRRALLARVGGFDPRLGAGGVFAAGEDVDFVYRAMQAGYQLLYAPNITVHHNHECVTTEQARQLEYNHGKGAVAYFVKHALKGDWLAIKAAYWSLHKATQYAFGKTPVTPEIADRASAYLRGFCKGIMPSLVRMW